MNHRNRLEHSNVTCAAAIALALFTWRTAVAAESLTPAHLAKIRTVTSARISPDGKHVAYVLSVPRQPLKDDDGAAWAELHVVDMQGNARPFITGKVNIDNVAWTPDGRGISFTAKRGKDEHAALYIIPIDGGEARNVLAPETGVGAYTWSPDGTQVAFQAEEKQPKDEKEIEDKGFAPNVYEEDWKPTRLWIGTIDKPDLKPCAFELKGSVGGARWSPDGAKIAVVLSPTALVDDDYMNSRYHLIDGKEGKTLGIIETDGKLGDCAWSPDGALLALIAGVDRNDPSTGGVFVVPASGGKPRNLLPDFGGHASTIAWQDNSTLMYVADIGCQSVFGEVSADGKQAKMIVQGRSEILSGLTLARDGQTAACIGSTSAHPGEVFTMQHGSPGPRRLTDSNPWLKEIRLAKQLVVNYKARDGLELEGILIRPLDEQPGRKYPLVLSVHGGPEAHESNGWLTQYARPGQLAAAAGMGVFYPNYRGSTGRGVTFSKLGQNDPAGKEFDDLIDAVDHLTKNDVFDAAKVGVTGGSYGGYATAWCATRFSERFAAAIMFCGISNKLSKFGTTDIPTENECVHEFGHPWDDWTRTLERSPIYHAGNARTPTLVFHGKDDPRVHPSQGLEFYRNLKERSKAPVRLVLYPGEGHGCRKAANRLDYNLRMLQWFEHYLNGAGGAPPPYKVDYHKGLGMTPPSADEKAEEKQPH